MSRRRGKQERTLALPGGVVLSVRASAQVWSYPNLHGDVIITTNSAGTRQGGVAACDPFGQPIDPVTGNIGSIPRGRRIAEQHDHRERELRVGWIAPKALRTRWRCGHN